MSQTEQAVTEHGEVEYPVETCVSCGADFNKKNMAFVVVIDDLRRRKSWHDHMQYEVNHGESEEAYLCEYCRDTPSAYTVTTRPKFTIDAREVVVIASAFLIALAIILLVL